MGQGDRWCKKQERDGWTKTQALGQRINPPYWVMAKVKGSWLAARNAAEGPCPSESGVPNAGGKRREDRRDVSLFWIQCILCNVKSSARKLPSHPEEEQCKYLSFVQAGGCSWRCCVCAGPGSSGSRSEQPGQWAGKAPSQRQRRALLRASTAPAWWDWAWGASSPGSLSRATTPSNK